MPRLTDTSWRVLCVVVRQTLGWKAAGGHRKVQDWLSHSQLKKRTGRHSEAVSRAIQDLLNRGLIDVRDERGRRLTKAMDRSGTKKLYFSLSSGLLQLIHSLSASELRNPKATKQTYTKYKKPSIDPPSVLPRRGHGWTRVTFIPPSEESEDRY